MSSNRPQPPEQEDDDLVAWRAHSITRAQLFKVRQALAQAWIDLRFACEQSMDPRVIKAESRLAELEGRCELLTGKKERRDHGQG